MRHSHSLKSKSKTWQLYRGLLFGYSIIDCFRYISGVPLDLNKHKGSIFIHNEVREKTTLSKLVISRINDHDGGSYTCSPSGADNDTVIVSVKNPEKILPQSHLYNHADHNCKSVSVCAILILVMCACVRLQVHFMPN